MGYSIDNNNIDIPVVDYNHRLTTILSQQEEEACLYEKKENSISSLLYTSNEFINNYQFITDEETESDLNYLQQSSNQLTSYSKNDVYIQPFFNSITSEDLSSIYLFHPQSKRKASFVVEKNHICPICNHRSKRKHNLIEHMLTHNPHRPKSFLCSHCSRPFARKYDMKRHEKIHTR